MLKEVTDMPQEKYIYLRVPIAQHHRLSTVRRVLFHVTLYIEYFLEYLHCYGVFMKYELYCNEAA